MNPFDLHDWARLPAEFYPNIEVHAGAANTEGRRMIAKRETHFYEKESSAPILRKGRRKGTRAALRSDRP